MGRRGIWSVIGLLAIGTILPPTATAMVNDGPVNEPVTTTTPVVTAERPTLPRRFEPFGLSTYSPYVPGKTPVILVPGLWMGPQFWDATIRALESDPEISATHQFWTFGYATTAPLAYSGYQLRRSIGETRLQLDPDRADPALDRIVVIGHSMGGLVAKLAGVDSGDHFWRLASDQAPNRLHGDSEDVDLLFGSLVFQARPEVRKVIFLATPHHGGAAYQRPLHDAAQLLVRKPSPLATAYERLVAANPPETFHTGFRTAAATSINELRQSSPLLVAIAEMRPPPEISMHSIIAVRNGPPGPGGDDGVVTFENARLEGVTSEAVVPCGHFSCPVDPSALTEIRRILLSAPSP